MFGIFFAPNICEVLFGNLFLIFAWCFREFSWMFARGFIWEFSQMFARFCLGINLGPISAGLEFSLLTVDSRSTANRIEHLLKMNEWWTSIFKPWFPCMLLPKSYIFKFLFEEQELPAVLTFTHQNLHLPTRAITNQQHITEFTKMSL